MTKETVTRAYRNSLPYGVWTLQDGSEVLFNREYEPIIARNGYGALYGIAPDRWIPWVKQQWFYNDGFTPLKAERKGAEVFKDFIERIGISPFILDRYKHVEPGEPAQPFPAFLNRKHRV